jgi:hypothetical protein
MGDAVLWLPSEATTRPGTSDNVSYIRNLTAPGPRALAEGSMQPAAVCERKKDRWCSDEVRKVLFQLDNPKKVLIVLLE